MTARPIPVVAPSAPASSASPLHRALFAPEARWQAPVIAGVLAALMILTRGQHGASVDALPSASWAVFFLAGMLLRARWSFAAFFGLATALDVGSLAAGTITAWCTSPAYWVLLPAYASLWWGGRFYAARYRNDWSALPRLLALLSASAVVAYLVSKGGFYFLSGHYAQPTLAGFLLRIPQYFPPAAGGLAGYVGLMLGALLSVRALRGVGLARRATA